MNLPFMRNGKDDPQRAAIHEEPLFPHFNNLPTNFDPRSRRISEAAAGAAQYVIDLEAEVGRLKEELGFERNSNSLVTEANKILHEQIAALEQENRKLRESNGRVRTKLQVSGAIVLDAMREAESWQELAEDEQAIAESQQQAIAAAMGEKTNPGAA